MAKKHKKVKPTKIVCNAWKKYLWPITWDIFDEVSLLLIATATSFLIPNIYFLFQDRFSASVKDGNGQWGYNMLSSLVVILVLITILIQLCVKFKIVNLAGKRKWRRSTLMLGIIGTFLYCACRITPETSTGCVIWIDFILIASFYFSYRIVQKAIAIRKEPKISHANDENPIHSAKKDKLGFRDYAVIAADKMMKDGICGVALLGEYGCGKSSFANLMKKYIKKKYKNTVVIRIDGWGLKEGSTVEYILNQIENKLSKYADTLSISTIPEASQDLFSMPSNGILGILSIFKRKKSFYDLLSELDRYLSSIYVKIVLILEDLDRNSEDGILFSEIASFVDTCKKQNNIFIILPLAERESTNIAIRCCGYYHIFSAHYLPYVELFKDFIASFEEANGASALNLRISEQNTHIDLDDVIISMSKMIDSPRQFFSIKRKSEEDWKKFKGEINFYDFLIYQLLFATRNKTSAGLKSGYGYLIENLEYIYNAINNKNVLASFSSILVPSEKPPEKPSEKGFIEGMKSASVPEYQQNLLIYLFKQAFQNKSGQHLLCNNYTDYFLYMQTGVFNIQGKICKNLSDKIILGKIQDLNSGNNATPFFELFKQYDSLSMKIEQFDPKFELTPQLVETMCYIVSEEEISKNRLSVLQQFTELLCSKEMDDILEDNNTLEFHWKKLFHVIFLNHPAQFKEICTYLKFGGPGTTENKKWGSLIAESLKNVCENDSVKFIDALSRSPYKTLDSITFDSNNYQMYDTINYADWLFLGEWLGKSINKAPKTIILNLLYLTTGGANAEQLYEKQFVFIPYCFLLFFGKNSKQLFDIFAREYNLKFEKEEKIQEVLYYKAQHIAQNILHEFSNSKSKDFFDWLKNEKYKEGDYWSQDRFAQL